MYTAVAERNGFFRDQGFAATETSTRNNESKISKISISNLEPAPCKASITSHWLKGWEADFGLSMRNVKRKFKVPKKVMAERCQATWLNLARARILCMLAHGYDPELENFDQSPFHNNESGSQNTETLAVAGAFVPLIENHSAT